MSRFHIFGLSFLLLGALAAPAFAGGDLKRLQDARSIEAQKTIRQAETALAEAKRLATSDPALARQLLLTAKGDVEASQCLSESQVADWLGRLNTQLGRVQAEAREQEATKAEAVRREVEKA